MTKQKTSSDLYSSIQQTETENIMRIQFSGSKTQTKEFSSNDKLNCYYSYSHEQNGQLLITLKDQGIGISKEQQTLLFNPFQQANSDIQKQFGGTGLGLWICKRIVDEMGGSIQLKSHLGMGTTFIIKIPLTVYKQTDNDQNFSPNYSNTSNSPLIQMMIQDKKQKKLPEEEPKQSILFVNVKLEIKTKIKQMLSQKVDIVNATTGDQALKLFEKDDYDFVIINGQIPDYNSFEVAENIRELQKQKKKKQAEEKKISHLSILMVCKNIKEKEIYEALNTPFDGIITSKDDEDFQCEFSKILRKKKSTKESLQNKVKRNLIMIIDDDVYIQRMLQTFLENFGFKVIACQDGQQGLQNFKRLQNQIQLIICDYEMPIMNGAECAKKIRQFEEKGNEENYFVPIIICSGNEGEFYEQQAIEVGALFQTKPIGSKQLQKIIQEYNLIQNK